MIATLLLIASYLIGSVSAGIVVAKLMGLGDPRDSGSGNPGATNVLRLGGRIAAAVTLILDGLKGVLPVLAANALGMNSGVVAGVGLAAFLGHLYPIFFGFRGGKGIATGFGVLLAWSWPIGLIGLITWLIVAAVMRISSLAALGSFALAPLALIYLDGRLLIASAMAVMALLTAWRHRSNIQRLINGSEPRIGQR